MIKYSNSNNIIAKTATSSRNVAFKAAKMSESVFAGQSDILIPEIVTVDSSTHEEDLEDVVTFLTTARIVLDS